jgi:transcription elongation GreA/GreB family factor
MREQFERLIAAGKLKGQHLSALLRLADSGYCLHRSWGVGTIRGFDTVFGRVTIDFPNRPGHVMDLGFAAESLKPLSRDHFLARKTYDLPALRQLAVERPVELVRLVLQSYGGQLSLETLQQLLVPDVVGSDWKRWWDSTRHALKKDGHFVVPTRKPDPILYQEAEVPLEQRLLAQFDAAKGLKAKLCVAAELLRSLPDLQDGPGTVAQVLAALNADIASHHRTQPWLALEAVFMRDDLRAAVHLPAEPGELTTQDIWAQAPPLDQMLQQTPTAKHKRLLQSFKEAHPEDWHQAVLAALNSMSAKNTTECARLLIEEGHLESLKRHLAQLINQHQASSELLLWLARERSDAFADILGPEVFRAMLTAMERDQFNQRKSNRLGDYILADQDLLPELIESAELEVIEDLTRALKFSPCFNDMDKRSLLGRIVKKYPSMQPLISGEQPRTEAPLLVSWESLQRRKQEYDELVHKKIPANSREIALARSYGDLNENYEYKAAKEMQRLLLTRKAELERMLLQAQGTDFANPRTDVVSPGTTVRCIDLAQQTVQTFTVLGAWDYDPDRGVVSYLSPLGQALLNHKVGDEVQFELEGAVHRYRIEAIEPWRSSSTDVTTTPTAPPDQTTSAGEEAEPAQPQVATSNQADQTTSSAAPQAQAEPGAELESASPHPGPVMEAPPAHPEGGQTAPTAVEATLQPADQPVSPPLQQPCGGYEQAAQPSQPGNLQEPSPEPVRAPNPEPVAPSHSQPPG